MLKLEAVSRLVNGRPLLDGVSLSLRAGETAALLGPSGSGKSTLLRLIAGFDAPTEGAVWIHGARASEPGRVLLPPERRQLSLALQDATLYPHLDAVGNVAFAVTGGTRRAKRDRAKAMLIRMGLHNVDGRAVGTLSGGEAQRVALARALAREAPLLLLDEPFGNVDRPTRADLLDRLREHLGGGVAALVVTHDPRDADELGTRVLVLREGRLVADGSPQALLSDQTNAWAASFLRTH